MSTNYHTLRYPFESLNVKWESSKDDGDHAIITASGNGSFFVARCPDAELGTIIQMVVSDSPVVWTYYGGSIYGKTLCALSGYKSDMPDSTVLVSENGDIQTLGSLKKLCQTITL